MNESMNEPAEAGDEMATAMESEIQAPSPADAAAAMKLAQQVLAGQGPKKRGKHWKRRIIERRQGKATKAQRRRHSEAMERKATRRFEVVTGRRAFRSTPTVTATEATAAAPQEA